MTTLIVDSHLSHAPAVALLRNLLVCDLIYYSDRGRPWLNEVEPNTRSARVLSLLYTHARARLSRVIVLGRGMIEARSAITRGADKYGVEVLFGGDIIAEHTRPLLKPGDVCLIGTTCFDAKEASNRFAPRKAFEISAPRIEAMYSGDEPLRTILRNWGRSVGTYIVASAASIKLERQIVEEDPGAEVVDEFDVLALALADRIPRAASPSLRACVTEYTPAIGSRLALTLGLPQEAVAGTGRPEPGPLEGPFAISLDEAGEPI